jgi:two-component system response regulator (stage 0 sporulation protein F)
MKEKPDTILIVDDEVAIRSNLQELFQNAGWAVCTASSGESAIEKVGVGWIDVVLLDLRMPSSQSGLDVIEPMLRVRPELCIIVFTAYGDTPVTVDAMRRGAWNFVEKGIEFSLLESLVRESLKNFRELNSARRQLQEKESQLLRNEQEKVLLLNEKLAAMKSTMTLANGIAHDIKNRLTDCGLTVRLAVAEHPSVAVLARLAEIQNALVLTAEAVDSVYSFGRLQELVPEPTVFGSILQTAILAVEARRKFLAFVPLNIKINGEQDILLRNEPRALTKAIENVVFNASDSIGKGEGSIDIFASNSNGLLILRFVDSGVGFEAAVLSTADLPYHTTKGKSNYGIGLAYAKEVATHFGGYLRFGNNEVKGAWVEFGLPLWGESES